MNTPRQIWWAMNSMPRMFVSYSAFEWVMDGPPKLSAWILWVEVACGLLAGLLGFSVWGLLIVWALGWFRWWELGLWMGTMSLLLITKGIVRLHLESSPKWGRSVNSVRRD